MLRNNYVNSFVEGAMTPSVTSSPAPRYWLCRPNGSFTSLSEERFQLYTLPTSDSRSLGTNMCCRNKISVVLIPDAVLLGTTPELIDSNRNADFVTHCVNALRYETNGRHVDDIYKSISWHHNDVIMGVIASQITSLYSDADQRKHQSSASLAFVRGIHRGLVNSPHKRPVTRKMFPFDDVIMNENLWICIRISLNLFA